MDFDFFPYIYIIIQICLNEKRVKDHLKNHCEKQIKNHLKDHLKKSCDKINQLEN